MKKLALLSLSFISASLYGQILDTSDVHTYKPVEVYTFTESGLRFLLVDSQRKDTSLLDFYNYYPPYRSSFPFLDLGFESSPVYYLSGPVKPYIGLAMGTETLDANFLSDEIISNLTPRPFTRLNYSQGPKEMISIEAEHAQQISERLTIGLEYRRIRNQNIYYSDLGGGANRTLGNVFSTKLYTGYYNQNRSYEILGSYRWNKNTLSESGGLANSPFFDSLEGRLKEGNNPARLSSAENRNRIHHLNLVQFIRFGGSMDSTRPHDLSRFRAQLILKHQFYDQRLEYLDEFPDSLYYEIRIPELSDSMLHRMTVNEASIMLRLGPVKLIGGLEHRYDGIYQNGFVDRFHTLFALAELQGEISDLELNARGRLGLSGYNPGDYLLKANLGWRTDLLKLKAGIHSSLTEAAFLAQKIISFPRTWENDLKKISINSLEFSAAIESDLQYLSAEFIISNYLNLVYYTNNGWVQQEQQSVQHIQSSLIYKLKWKPLSFELKLINQELSNQNVLPRPQWSADGKLYSNLLIFKKKLNIQIGFEGYWFSDFKAPEYIPFIRQWGISDSMFSSYPPVQFFLNARVQSLNFGISVFHVQEQVMGTRFYSSPAYPMLPRLFRLNILWDLKN